MIKNKNKYKNNKITKYNIKFDSIAELQYYEYLLTVYKKDDIIIKPKFVLQNKFFNEYENKTYSKIIYEADFQIDNIVIDVKGFPSPVAKLKRKLFINKYPTLILEWIILAPKKYGGDFIKYDELNAIRKSIKK